MLCVSFHWSKTLGGVPQGGAILHDDEEADAWLRRARFDGRTEGVAPKDDTFTLIGWHCYMSPTTSLREACCALSRSCRSTTSRCPMTTTPIYPKWKSSSERRRQARRRRIEPEHEQEDRRRDRDYKGKVVMLLPKPQLESSSSRKRLSISPSDGAQRASRALSGREDAG
jgi:hypothetical protein